MSALGKHVDYKATVWGRLYFDDSVNTEDIIKKLEEGYLPSDLCDVSELKFDRFEFIQDTEEFMSVSENDGESTIEVFDDFDKCVWDNSFESELKRKNNEIN